MPTVTWVYRSKTLNKKMIRVNLKRRLGYIQPKATLICDYLLNTTTKHGTERNRFAIADPSQDHLLCCPLLISRYYILSGAGKIHRTNLGS